jgi:uncharacterized membrane protein YidH (DUF202 family)
MENNQPLDRWERDGQGSGRGLQITDTVRKYWRELVIWGRVFASLSIFNFLTTIQSASAKVERGVSTWGLEALQIVISAVLTILICYFLFSFSHLTRRGLNEDDPDAIERGASNLKNYFVTVGIVLGFVLVVFIIVVLGLLTVGASRF